MGVLEGVDVQIAMDGGMRLTARKWVSGIFNWVGCARLGANSCV